MWCWGWGIIKKSFHKHLEIGVGLKAKIVHKGEGVERMSPPLPPSKNLNRTPSILQYLHQFIQFEVHLLSVRAY